MGAVVSRGLEWWGKSGGGRGPDQEGVLRA